MYAIKIENNESVTFHEANEITYEYREYINKEDFLNKVNSIYYSYQLGETPSEDKSGCFLDIGLYRHSDGLGTKHGCIIPNATIYIMQDGKTIEIIKVTE
jgi:hypothetical protein